ncbi:inter-alpha-trypsin inhibitor heavy chain H3-like isoform X1 [Mytilus edulis]
MHRSINMCVTTVSKVYLNLLCLLLMQVKEQVLSQTLKPEIKSMHISSDIYFRFATTVVETKILNVNQEASEVMFDMTLPDSAFITGFTMEIGGKRYAGNVKEKEKAKKQFEEAKSRGESAGHIAASPRTSNKFNILVNVERNASVVFKLKYQELLKRTLGSYHHVIYVDPGQIVEDFEIKVYISESRDIIDLSIPPLDGKTKVENVKFVNIKHVSPKRIDIRYAPSVQNQKAMSKQGISGQFKVKYDVTRDKDAGDLLVVNGYFVHMFAPKDIKPLSKDVMFVLDKSGSMQGRKMNQLKEAMKLIIQDMKPEDKLNILFFDSKFDWLSKTEMLEGTQVNFDKANRFIDPVIARGGTNINTAVTDGIKLLTKHLDTNRSAIVMFLTDGRATSGETLQSNILKNVKTENEARVPIFSLGFGNNLDFNFLKQMSAQNNGFARRIYEDSDASLQIKGLYSEISSALLKNVSFDYVGDVDMNTLTQTRYPSYFGGSELIVSGKMNSNDSNIVPRVTGWNNGYIDLIWKPRPVPDLKAITTDTDLAKITEKMWAYLTIKQLLKDIEDDITTTMKDKIKAKVISLATKYQFVTPFTSMVVTAPELRQKRQPRPSSSQTHGISSQLLASGPTSFRSMGTGSVSHFPSSRGNIGVAVMGGIGGGGRSFSVQSFKRPATTILPTTDTTFDVSIISKGTVLTPAKTIRPTTGTTLDVSTISKGTVLIPATTLRPTTDTTLDVSTISKGTVVIPDQRSPNFFLHLKGSTAPLCMNLNPNETGRYQFLYSSRKPHKALHIIFEKTINQQKKIENIKAVEIREGTEQQYLDSTVLKVSNATSNVTKLWNDISNKTTTDFPSYNLTVAVSPYKDPLLGLQLHLYIRQSNNVNATGPLRWFVGMEIKSFGLELIVKPNEGKQFTVKKFKLLKSTSVSSYLTDSCWYIINPEKEIPQWESLFQQKDVDTWL